jgi:hypothetical protein
MATVDDVCTNLWDFLNSIGTAHYFSMLGLIDEQERVAKMLAISASEGNDDPVIHLGTGSPAGQGWVPFLSRPMKQLHAELEPGARVSDLVGHMWITTTYTAWETALRSALEKAAGLDQNAVLWPHMGDLRCLRHDIVHHRGIGTPEWTGRCEVLGWAEVGEMISIGPPHSARGWTGSGTTTHAPSRSYRRVVPWTSWRTRIWPRLPVTARRSPTSSTTE